MADVICTYETAKKGGQLFVLIKVNVKLNKSHIIMKSYK